MVVVRITVGLRLKGSAKGRCRVGVPRVWVRGKGLAVLLWLGIE